jgi:hypothetical protein
VETKAPESILNKADAKYAKNQQGLDILVPKGVSDKFAQHLNKVALSGAGAQGSTVSSFQNLFNYYLSNVLESKTAMRMDRYEQMDFIIENDSALSLTRGVLIDEILQIDTYNDPITVQCENLQFKKAIEKFFEDIGIKSYLRDICSNLITYGDSFLIMDLQGEKGVAKLIPVDVRDAKQRFDFSIAELKDSKDKLKKRFTSWQTMIDLSSSIDTEAQEFNKVLLGFQIMNTMFPFWQVLHFRQFTTRKTIAPFGKPTFYEAQSEARMYLNAKIVISMIRSSAFMREHVKVKMGEGEDASSQWQKCQEVKQYMDVFITANAKSAKDHGSFGEKLYYPDGLIEIEKMESGYNFRDKFDDLQLMREDVFTATGLPKEYFVGGGSGAYENKQNLISQDKKAARKVFNLQTSIVDQLIKAVEVHFSHTGEFNPYEEKFALSLPYPVPDTDDSVVNLSTSKMQFATATIDSLKQALDITRIPEKIVRNLLTQYFPLKDEEVSAIIKQMKGDSEEEDEIGFSRLGMKAGDPFLQNKDSMDIQIDQGAKTLDANVDMVDQQKKMQDQQIQSTDMQIKQGEQQMAAADAEQQAAQPPTPLTDEDVKKIAKMSPEELQQLDPAQLNEMSEEQLASLPKEQQQIIMQILQAAQAQSQQPEQPAQPQQQQQQPAQAQEGLAGLQNWLQSKTSLTEVDYKMGLRIYRDEKGKELQESFAKATERVSLHESMEKQVAKSILEKGTEFVHGLRHFVSNRYVSEDRNIAGNFKNDKDSVKLLAESLIEKNKSKALTEGDESFTTDSKYNKTGLNQGTFVNEDASQDKRYDSKLSSFQTKVKFKII